MSLLVAKRYVKALVDGRGFDTLLLINEQLKSISSAYSNEKFLNIIGSMDVKNDAKVLLIESFVDNINDQVKNLISLLNKNRRLDIIPAISSELNNQISILSNSYNGVVYSSEELNGEYMLDMQNSFAKKFNIELKLVNEVCSYAGIKVEIDGLGVEINFSKERLKSQMMAHILEAV